MLLGNPLTVFYNVNLLLQYHIFCWVIHAELRSERFKFNYHKLRILAMKTVK